IPTFAWAQLCLLSAARSTMAATWKMPPTGLTICAERNAIFAAVAAEGTGMRIKAVAVATERDGPCAPCGACRQVIFEFGPDALILFRGQSGTQQMEITELL